MSGAETVVTGMGLLEGPVWRPATGDLLITVVGSGLILRVDLEVGRTEPFADAGGGPNGAYPCADGGLLITQNGGLDWDAIGIPNPTPSDPTTPGIQRVEPAGDVQLLTEADGPFRAPNDLCATANGTIWFTDPPQFPRLPYQWDGSGRGCPAAALSSMPAGSSTATASGLTRAGTS